MTDVDIKIENIVASASIGKDIVLTDVSQALEGVNFNREQFPGLVFKLKDPKTAALIFSSGKLVCTGAKSIDDSKLAIKKTVDLMREVDTEIPHEFEIKIQNIVASANLQSTLNLEAVALELEDTEYEPEQFPGLVYRLSDPKVVLLLFGSGKVVCTGAKTKSDAKLGVERAYDRLSELDLVVLLIKLVVFDLDNVIIDGEAIDEIGKLANVEDDIAAITEKAMQGEIDFETSIKDRVQLLEGTSIEEIEKVADELPLMPGASDTIARLKDEDVDVAIISGSFDVVADKVKEKLGIDTVYTNSFTVEDGKLTGEVTGPLVSGSKLDVLKDHVEKADISLEEVAAVGDGANDISMIESAGCGIAFNAKDSVKEIADVVVDEKDLTKVLDEILNQLTTEDTENDAVENEEAEAEEVEEVEEAEVAEAEDAETEDAEEKAEPAEEEKTEAEKPKNDLPKSEFVLADTMEGVRKQKDEKEAEISRIADEREEYNRIAKEQRKIRDELNASLKENLNKAIEYRNERNEINKAVEEAKKARNEANNQIKSLEWSSGKRDKVKIENEIKKIDKIIETRVLDIKKENQLVKNANDLRKQLMEIQEDESVKEEAQELRKVSEEEHEKVIALSEQAQAAHEEMLTYFRKTDDIRTAADDAHKKFIEARNNASAKHEEFKAVLSDIHVINKKLGSGKPRKRKSDKKPSSGANKNREEKERAEEIFEKFKQGGKLSTEELLLLQKYNIN